MSAIHQKVHFEVQGTSTNTDGQDPTQQGKVDPLLLALYYLLEASNISSKSALLHAKQINQNALSQQRLNAELGSLQNTAVPTLQEQKKQISHRHYYFVCWWVTHQTITIKLNQGSIDQSEAVNEQIQAQRQTLIDQMTTLQQSAHISETNVNSITSESIQTQAESTNLLQALQSLTFKALLTRNVNG